MIPSSVICNEIPWSLIHTPYMSDSGLTNTESQEVMLNDEMTEAAKKLTFWHEVIHVMRFSHDLPTEPLAEEDIAKYYGPALFSFLNRNCRIEWIKHEEESACRRGSKVRAK